MIQDSTRRFLNIWKKSFFYSIQKTILLKNQHTYTHIYTHIHTHIHTYTHIHTHTYTLTHIYTYIHTYSHTYTHIYTHIHTYTHIRSHTYTHIYTHIHTHIHTYTHTHTHTHIHTHTHTYTHRIVYLPYAPSLTRNSSWTRASSSSISCFNFAAMMSSCSWALRALMSSSRSTGESRVNEIRQHEPL